MAHPVLNCVWGRDYNQLLEAVTRSSHFTIPNMTVMEMMQTMRNTPHASQMGHLVNMSGPIQSRRLPTAVAPSQRPWHRPCMCLGATFETNESPRGEMNSSATVRKK